MKCFYSFLLVFLVCFSINGQEPESDLIFGFPQLSFKPSKKLVHHPPIPFFKNRLFNLELFVDFPSDSLEKTSLFLRTNKMKQFQEKMLKIKKGLYSFEFNPMSFPGDSLEYFFYVETKSSGYYALPLDSDGRIKPLKQKFVDPVVYYKQRRALNK